MKKIRALLVEDRPDDSILVVKQLQRGGYDVSFERVETEADFRRALAQGDWDIVLSDYSMPQFSALQALEIVNESRCDLPFIVVSGTVGEEVAVETMRLGAHDYILKGNLTRLCMAVERELRDAEHRRQQARAEAALIESEARFARLVENVPDIIYRIGLLPEPKLEYISKAVERVCGYEPHELLMAGDAIVRTIHADDRSTLLSCLANADYSARQLRWLHKNGEVRWLDHRNAPIFDDAGALIAVEGAARDVTDQQQLEEQLEVAQRMEAIGRLAGGVAHDFNNLLTVINSLSEMLVEDPTPGPEMVEDLRQIRHAGRAAAELTNQLLAFSRRQIRQVETIDLNDVVGKLDRMLRRLIGEDIALETVLTTELPYVDADRGQIEQIVMNLAVNARDAMLHGGKLTVETAPVELDAEYARSHALVEPGDYVMLAVSDDGTGMSEATQSHIFEPFFTTKSKGKGTGLGLSTVWGIVKQSGGHIFVYSELGKGTSFKIYLPVSKRGSAPHAARAPFAEDLTGTETVLIVEDSPQVRAVAARSLMRGGYDVLESTDEHDAIRIAKKHEGEIHMLLADIVMPVMSGKLVADTVRVYRPSIRVLFMSGYTDNAIVHHGVLDREVAFLQKPFTPAGLLKKVRAELDRKG